MLHLDRKRREERFGLLRLRVVVSVAGHVLQANTLAIHLVMG
jgi:hypothetical protein